MTTDSISASSEQPAEAPLNSPGTPEIDPSRLDADAVRVVLRLRQAGHQAYLVGGCVRDLLIGRSPKDFDLATSATPNQIRSLFRNCRLIGRRFRLAHIYFKGGKILEVSTFRANPAMPEDPQPSEAVEGEVVSEGTEHIAQADQEALAAVESDAPVPNEPVSDLADELTSDGADEIPAAPPSAPDLLITEDNTFGTELEDALRRDFTINGLFYDPVAGQVIDHVNGLRDLAREEIRTIGDPEKRLREDPVRILRGVRFACKIEYDIESRTYAAMEGAVEDLTRCSAPRLLEETFRLIRGGQAAPALKLVRALDALKSLLPPIDAYLSQSDAEAVTEYFRFVSELDAMIARGVPFDDAMVLAVIVMPLALDEPEAPEVDDGSRPATVAASVEALLREFMQKARLPRRIAERCRSILLSQRTLAGQRRRRGGLSSFRAHPLFNESLAVFEVWSRATGEHAEALEKWKSGSAPVPAPDAPGPKRRKRRRRGGGGRTEGAPAQGDGAQGSAAPTASAPTMPVPAVSADAPVAHVRSQPEGQLE